MGNANPKALRLEHASKTGVLSLENMKLTKVPPEVAKKLDPKVNRRVVLMRMRTVSVAGNGLIELPSWMPSYTSLKTLDLQRNALSSLPNFAPLRKLETLNLHQNKLSTIPPCIFELASLKSLTLSKNLLAGIPPEGFGKLKKLRVLDLSQNRLQGLPADCGEYCMQELNLRNNQITAIPVALASASLQILRLESNAVAREGIPPEYLKTSSVSMIALDGNPVTTRQFQGIAGYNEYETRFTASKKKMAT